MPRREPDPHGARDTFVPRSLARKQTPRTMIVRVIVQCPNVPHPESDRADWCMAEIADHLERSGLADQGYTVFIDDAYMAEPRPEGNAL